MKIIELENGCYKEIEYYNTKENKIMYIHYLNSNNQLHNLDGPAAFFYYRNGEIKRKHYYINNKEYSKEEFDKKLNIERNLKLLNKK